jgi:preprotein translocase subunit SecY
MASAAEQLAANINFAAFAKATELQKRIWYTVIALIVYRIGTFIPFGVDPRNLRRRSSNKLAASSACSIRSPAAPLNVWRSSR